MRGSHATAHPTLGDRAGAAPGDGRGAGPAVALPRPELTSADRSAQLAAGERAEAPMSAPVATSPLSQIRDLELRFDGPIPHHVRQAVGRTAPHTEVERARHQLRMHIGWMREQRDLGNAGRFAEGIAGLKQSIARYRAAQRAR